MSAIEEAFARLRTNDERGQWQLAAMLAQSEDSSDAVRQCALDLTTTLMEKCALRDEVERLRALLDDAAKLARLNVDDHEKSEFLHYVTEYEDVVESRANVARRFLDRMTASLAPRAADEAQEQQSGGEHA